METGVLTRRPAVDSKFVNRWVHPDPVSLILPSVRDGLEDQIVHACMCLMHVPHTCVA